MSCLKLHLICTYILKVYMELCVDAANGVSFHPSQPICAVTCGQRHIQLSVCDDDSSEDSSEEIECSDLSLFRMLK